MHLSVNFFLAGFAIYNDIYISNFKGTLMQIWKSPYIF